jgi:acetyl/propionyl-CoA carboxylase alpha subunit
MVMPEGPGVRVDCGVAAGFQVPRFYDPMIAKIAAWGVNRESARRRLHRALGETAVKGITTNTTFLHRLLEAPAFIDGSYHTGSIADILREQGTEPSQEVVDIAVAASVINTFRRDTRGMGQAGRQGASTDPARASGWRTGPWRWRGG